MRAYLYAPAGPKRKVVLLVHGENEEQRAWLQVAQDLNARGVAALTLDLRGYGETGGAEDASKLPADLDVAVRYLRSEDWPLIFVAGSDIGGTAGLKLAASQDLAGVVALSAPAGVAGLDAVPDMSRITEPALLLAGANDAGAAAALATLGADAPGTTLTQAIDGTAAHGIALLQNAAVRQALLTLIGN
jgi:alpha-beta hydrolase superfamily lysophospholipase